MRHQIRWTAKKISQRIELIESQVYRQRVEIPLFKYKYLKDPLDPPPITTEVDDSAWETIQTYAYWAHPRTNFILRTKFNTADLKGDTGPVALFLPIGTFGDFSHPEALVYIDGEPLAGCDRHHQEIVLPEEYCDGQDHSLALHGWTGIGGDTIGDMTNRLKMNPCQIVQIDQLTRDFVALARVTLGICEHLVERDPAKHGLLTTLDEAFKVVDIRNPIGEAFYRSIPKALKKLRSGVDQAGPSLNVEIDAVGHAHIDVAWLWTLGQTRRKAGRTFHTVLRLMEQFPGYIFGQSQPQLYDYIRRDYPKLFEAIKDRIDEGCWEPIGGMWVEADCNLSGPESLARQFLLGRTFFREHFGEGAESPVLWLPDVFGYAWNLPQLIKEAGLEYFFTIKIGWSQYNRLPYDSFWWQGLDGTKVLTHFSTTKDPGSPYAATYNADASPSQTLGTWTNFQQKDDAPAGKSLPLLMSYGFGDGGGGPTREMLEDIREMSNFPSTPQIQTSKVGDFFRKLEAVSEKLPTWNGELYLEYHRGTFTTQARNKKANRKSEFRLHDAEFVATYATLLDSSYQYPKKSFQKAWQLVCLNQFHDIIPGSSIAPVYQESLEQYEQVRQIAMGIRDQALEAIASKIGVSQLVVNPAPFPRAEPVVLDGALADLGELPAYSITSPADDRQGITEYPSPVICHPAYLENAFLRVEFNSDGDISRIYDKKANREVLPQSTLANQFQAFEDIPLSWDAWDIDIFYDDKIWFAEPATSIKVVESSPLRATLEIKRRILNSDYTQRISLQHNAARLDFDTQIDWQERQILLKVVFPVEVLTPTATYEIQWGNVKRPTHRNTSWDWARFETAAQKWVDLSEGDYGVSLINDCKYGHDIRDNVIRLTLLRGTTAPDPMADYGEHSFKYSLYPHAGNWNEKTISEAYALNDPMIVYQPQVAGRSSQHDRKNHQAVNEKLPIAINQSFVTTNQPNVIVETIKRAEDGNGIIVRLYESQRMRGTFILTTAFNLATAWKTNILEENQIEIDVDGNQLHLQIKPYQILTLRLVEMR